MSDTTITPPTNEPETIDTDILCINCSYNLRTLAANHRCPECGDDVQPSIDSYRNHGWTKRISPGLTWLIVAQIVSFLTMMPIALIQLLSLTDIMPFNIFGNTFYVAWTYTSYLTVVILLIGVLLLTRTTTDSPIRRDTAQLRTILRYVTITLAIYMIASTFLWVWASNKPRLFQFGVQMIRILLPTLMTTLLVLYVSRIATSCDYRFNKRRMAIWVGLAMATLIGVAGNYYWSFVLSPRIATLVPADFEMLMLINALQLTAGCFGTAIEINIYWSLRKHIRRLTAPLS